MKKSILVAFSLIALCSLSLSVVIVNAFSAGYTLDDFNTDNAPVMDGKYTTATEWNGGAAPSNLPAGLYFKEMWTYPADIIQHYIVEALTDSTNDTGDYFVVAYDANADGLAAPQPDDYKFEYAGHRQSGLTVYKGNGTGWVKFTGWVAGDVAVAESLSTSPQSSTAHFIMELTFDKSKSYFDITGSSYTPGIIVGFYDASNAAAGVKAWPPVSVNSPKDYAQELGTMSQIPESLTVVAVVLLSSVAIVTSFYFLRKRPKTETFSPSGKVGYAL